LLIIGNRFSFDDGEHLACGNRYAFCNAHLDNAPGLWRFDFVLHLHRLDHDDALACGYFIADIEQNTRNLARHRGREILAAFASVVRRHAPVLSINYIDCEYSITQLYSHRVRLFAPRARFVYMISREYQIRALFRPHYFEVILALAYLRRYAPVALFKLDANLTAIYFSFVSHIG
jgi:hypothetical protein